MNMKNPFKADMAALTQQPCWGFTNGYGSSISFNVGQPRLEIREPERESDIASLRESRNVTLRGDYWFWLEMCEWDVLRDNHVLAHSESAPDAIYQAINFLDGQILKQIIIQPEPLVTTFIFDLGGSVEMRAPTEAEPDDALWNIYINNNVYSLCADGFMEYGAESSDQPKRYPPMALDVRF